jgi:hypothetical protein
MYFVPPKVTVVGGLTQAGAYNKNTWTYDVTGNQWKNVFDGTNQPAQNLYTTPFRHYAAMTAVGNSPNQKLYSFGGWQHSQPSISPDPKGLSNALWMYDPSKAKAGERWVIQHNGASSTAPLPRCRSTLTASADGNFLYLFGGYVGTVNLYGLTKKDFKITMVGKKVTQSGSDAAVGYIAEIWVDENGHGTYGKEGKGPSGMQYFQATEDHQPPLRVLRVHVQTGTFDITAAVTIENPEDDGNNWDMGTPKHIVSSNKECPETGMLIDTKYWHTEANDYTRADRQSGVQQVDMANDLWKFDIAGKTWTRVETSCTGTSCCHGKVFVKCKSDATENVGDEVTQETSGATAIVLSKSGKNLVLEPLTGLFENDKKLKVGGVEKCDVCELGATPTRRLQFKAEEHSQPCSPHAV